MLLTITLTNAPATDLGYLLHKNPARVQTLRARLRHGARLLPRGERRALHGRAAARRRPGRAGPRGRRRRAVARASTSTTGPTSRRRSSASPSPRCSAPRWAGGARSARSCADQPLPLEAALAGRCPAAGGEALLRRLFEPLGYAVDARPHPLDAHVPRVGREPLLHRHAARRRCRLRDLLAHLYVLHPGARRREALLGQRRRDREAAAARRGLARRRTPSAS